MLKKLLVTNYSANFTFKLEQFSQKFEQLHTMSALICSIETLKQGVKLVIDSKADKLS